MPGMEELTTLLMQTLMQQGQGMEPGADPYSTGQAEGGTGRRDPFSRSQAMGGSAASKLAEQLGVDEAELSRPVEGPMAEAMGISGVTPDFDKAESLFKLMQASKQLGAEEAMSGMSGGGMPQEDPELRSALAYQALQESAQGFGQGHIGGNMIRTMSPALAPLMMGPLLERRAMEERQAAQAAMQLKLEDTRSKGDLRRAQIKSAEATAALAEGRLRNLGKGKDAVRLLQYQGRVAIYDKEGNLIKIDDMSGPKAKDPYILLGKGDRPDMIFRNKDAMAAGEEPLRTIAVQPSGSAGERRTLAETYGNIKKGREVVKKLYNEKFVGPLIGRAFEAQKASEWAAGQAAGNAYVLGSLTKEEQKQAIEFYSALEQLNANLIFYYSKSTVPVGEKIMRRKHLAMGSDYPTRFMPALDSVLDDIETVAVEMKRLRGIDVTTGEAVAPAPPESRFIGEPSTPGSGVLEQRYKQELLNDFELQ